MSMSPTITSDHRPSRLPATTLVRMLAMMLVLAVGVLFLASHLPVPTEKDRLAALKARLSALREAADLYYHEHGHRYPGEYDPADGETPYHRGDESDAAAAFVRQLTRFTDRAGRTSERRTARFNLGPYLASSTLPDNPLMKGAAAHQVQIDFTETRPYVVYPADGRTGWRYYLRTGRLAANDNMRLKNGAQIDYQ